ncbi:hypothetical protein MVES1_002367 [Malassezia vespertilionis]|uniref:Mediator of RNA polymerase II transcription subunit 4 n=1 Tax=Malassezia vespertilionis TaxID=2020962 RepID=A0A2N1JBF1_9BASI|nr:uncharacterized protein MVES1_002367 [Malassezia vespertilionis]PKI83874.1 hypothetical protein MVES_002233 [Malassezia vespertilionis]WFD07011.1 hypothetical protein MVES1_002367 [Malassezia vespertilionis]
MQALETTLAAFQEHTTQLFNALNAQASLVVHDAQARDTSVAEHLAALEKLDASLGPTLAMAATHQANQARLNPLLQEVKQRDAQQRDAIAEIASMRGELQSLLQMGEAERDEMQRAEQNPLLYKDVLHYAQRLSKYTAAPPGYRLEVQNEGVQSNGPAVRLAADYNQQAARAAGYYDPAISSMAQDLPYPSDRLMRQGILYADAAADGVQPEPGQGSAPTHDTTEASTAHEPVPEALDAFAMDDDDAFDLDLNP